MLQAGTGIELTRQIIGGTIWQAKVGRIQGLSGVQVDPSYTLLELEEACSGQHSPQRK